MPFYHLPFGHAEWHTDPRDPRALRASRDTHGPRRASVRRPR